MTAPKTDRTFPRYFVENDPALNKPILIRVDNPTERGEFLWSKNKHGLTLWQCESLVEEGELIEISAERATQILNGGRE